ncbi:hypothetical protein TNCT_291871 [Trichonephila clavata]|uniref:Uncharacterized protein n=1 Tax=Trichonephila clavata TaxID=2740835 RepID=A0A8X6HDM7_TRICU|nr:hypothetical protein TNCT_291871 [Trichonephila clavata]
MSEDELQGYDPDPQNQRRSRRSVNSSPDSSTDPLNDTMVRSCSLNLTDLRKLAVVMFDQPLLYESLILFICRQAKDIICSK